MNKRVYFLAGFCFIASICLAFLRLHYGGQTIRPEFERELWRISTIINIAGKGERAKVRLTLPQNTARQIIYNENFDNDELIFYIRERTNEGNRVGFWRSKLLASSKTINYTFSAQLRKMEYPLPENLMLSKALTDSYPPEMQKWLNPSEYIQSDDATIKGYLKKIAGKEKNVAVIVRKIYDFIRGNVVYRTEKNSKDAKDTLDKLVAACGGQARLFVALSRAAGIPSRVVGGIILTKGVKHVTHVWAENYINGMWIPFDVVNNHFASTPGHYVELYRGDYSLIKHTGLASMDYFFVIGDERIPPVDHPWSLYGLPLNFQNSAKILLLLPIGVLMVAFARTIIGIPTFGTFAPVLLALAFREVSLWIGVLCVVVFVLIGWILRSFLDYLKILIIPKLSLLVTAVIMMLLSTMILASHFGYQRLLYISLFPMIIITWTIERFSVILIEDGPIAALTAAIGTILVATGAYYVIDIHILNVYIFEFPEFLLFIMGLLLLLGRYTGMRLTEIWRFREFLKKHPGD